MANKAKLAAALLLGSLGWAFYALSDYYSSLGLAYTAWDLLYGGLRLFTMSVLIPPGTATWSLKLAAILSPLAAMFTITVYAIIAAAALTGRLKWRLLRLKGQTVICGYGYLGRILARHYRRAGRPVVVIELKNHDGWTEFQRDSGMTLIPGDAAGQGVLQKARLEYAGSVVIVCGDEAANLLVATAVAKYLGRVIPRSPVDCRLHLPHLDNGAAQGFLAVLDRQNPHLNIQGFDPDTVVACGLLEKYPLDRETISEKSGVEVQLVLVGYNHFSKVLALAAAQTAHYANGRPPRLVFFDHPVEAEDEFRARHPQAEEAARFVFTGLRLESQAGRQALEEAALDEGRLTTLVFCDEHPIRAFGQALLPPLSVREKAFTLVRAWDVERGALSEFLGKGEADFGLQLFGAYALDLGLALGVDDKARIIHGYYAEKYPGGPNAGPWETLGLGAKQSNRWQALHLSAKLRAVGCRLKPRNSVLYGDRVVKKGGFRDDEIETLARMEHNRWQANRRLAGYKRGERDERRLFHPDLLPYEDLAEDVKEKDRLFIKALPDLAERLGQVIVRSSGDSEKKP